MLTQREIFKVAFLERCAQLGLDMDETEMVAKEAIARLNEPTEKEAGIFGMVKDILGAGFSGAKTLGAVGAIGIGGASILGGAGIGYLAGRTRGISDDDVQQEKSRELIQAYRHAAERAQSKSRLRRRKKMKPNIIRSLV